MKLYKVCCTNITGIHGKPLLKDNVYPESDFMHLQSHINNGHAVAAGEIEDKPEETEEPVDTEKPVLENKEATGKGKKK